MRLPVNVMFLTTPPIAAGASTTPVEPPGLSCKGGSIFDGWCRLGRVFHQQEEEMAVRTRDEFSASVIVALRERVGSLCSNPACRCATTGPHSDNFGAARVGVAAHITAAAPGGPRYDASLSKEQRTSAENGIWLCRVCERKIDVDPERYSVSLLLDWKRKAEEEADRNLGIPRSGSQPKASDSDYHCPHCDTGFLSGRTVCVGCRGQIVWGATTEERKAGMAAGMIAVGLPLLWLYGLLGVKLISSGTVSIFPLGIGLALALGGGALGVNWVEQYRRARNPRVFVRKLV
ncbi:HNH endonuclease [Ralstonia solanacearum]|nr:HNH endonuclease [Ralstonia solanacearum]NKF94158.1 HNH endonuclease [Ralstonia solanacearum]NKG09530.1 HNH endonuclease [Ralstonia solanacearum]